MKKVNEKVLKNVPEDKNPLLEEIDFDLTDDLLSNINERAIEPCLLKMIPFFNAIDYLNLNIDVKNSVENGEFNNALEHFTIFGFNEFKRGDRLISTKMPFFKSTSLVPSNDSLEIYIDEYIRLNSPTFAREFDKEKSLESENQILLVRPYFNEYKYLEANKDVKNAIKSGKLLNGFEHFVSHGFNDFKNGKRKVNLKWPLFKGDEKLNIEDQLKSYFDKHVKLSNEDDEKYVDVYISCWLRQKEVLHEIINTFAKGLMANGKKVNFVSHSPLILNDPSLDSINCGFSLFGSTIYKNEPLGNIPEEILYELSEVLKERAIAINDLSLAKDDGIITRLVKRAYSFWKRTFIQTKPQLVLVWGSTCAMSKLHISLCKLLQINYLVIERGHFPGTLSVDSNGQFAYGGSQLLPGNTDFKGSSYKDIVEWIRSNKEVAYANKNQLTELPLAIVDAKRDQRKVVLFIGVNDIGSGIAYNHKHIKEQHSSIFYSSKDAFQNIKDVLELVDPNALLIIKPHPADHFDYSIYENDRVLFVSNFNINELIKISDVCVTLSTTAIAQCIIEEKPIVTLAYTDVSNKKIAYECYDQSAIAHKLRMALDKIYWQEKNAAGKLFIQNLFSGRLYALNSYKEVVTEINQFTCLINERIDTFLPIQRRNDIAKKLSNTLPDCQYRMFELDSQVGKPNTRNLLDVVIPIYSDAKITTMCIDRVLKLREIDEFRLILINDASPDPEIEVMMNKYKDIANDNLLVFTNPKNLGFSGTVNKGIEISGDRDVILLNSDAFISSSFASKMQQAAYSHPKISTVSVFSNNAGVFSNPLAAGEPLDEKDVYNYVDMKNSLAIKQNGKICIEVPVGHGFCFLIRRNIINSIGYFDEASFGKGYSEEIDFALRARVAGFINVVLPSVFVGHIGGISFDDVPDNQRIQNREIIRKKFPSYFAEMSKLRSNDPLKIYRLS
jgi:GT2 family glycosyltransferase